MVGAVHLLVSSFVFDKQLRELLLQRFDLWAIANWNVRILRVVERVILMVVLGAVETVKRCDLGDDPSRKHLRPVELRDVSTRNPPLVIANIKDCGAIGSTHVRSLPVELGWIVGHGKEDPQQLAIGDFGGIIDHLDGFRMPGGFRRHLVVGCSRRGAAGISSRSMEDAFHSLKHRLSAPKTAAGEDRRLLARG